MKKRTSLSRKREWKGWIFVAPFAVGMIFFFLVPLLQSLWFSFGSVSMGANSDHYIYEWKGAVNYIRALTEELTFNEALLDSVGGMLAQVPVVIILSFLIAVLLKNRFPGRGLYRVLFFLPVILTAGILPAIDQEDVLQGLIGSGTVVSADAKNELSKLIETEFLTDTLLDMNINSSLVTYVMDAVSNIITVINSSGIQILIFLAALQTISTSVYEAAHVEGATGWETFWKITVPMITPQILVVAVYTIIDSFINVNNAVMQVIYNVGFIKFQIGYASAMSWMYFILIALVIGIFYLVLSRFVFYYNKER